VATRNVTQRAVIRRYLWLTRISCKGPDRVAIDRGKPLGQSGPVEAASAGVWRLWSMPPIRRGAPNATALACQLMSCKSLPFFTLLDLAQSGVNDDATAFASSSITITHHEPHPFVFHVSRARQPPQTLSIRRTIPIPLPPA